MGDTLTCRQSLTTEVAAGDKKCCAPPHGHGSNFLLSSSCWQHVPSYARLSKRHWKWWHHLPNSTTRDDVAMSSLLCYGVKMASRISLPLPLGFLIFFTELCEGGEMLARKIDLVWNRIVYWLGKINCGAVFNTAWNFSQIAFAAQHLHDPCFKWPCDSIFLLMFI